MQALDKLRRQFLTGRVTRRDFNQRLLALGLSGASVGSIMTAAIDEAAAATPKRGGRLRLATGSATQTETMDPAKAVTAEDVGRVIGIGNRLVDRHREGRLEPALAVSWQPNADASRWTFELRKGVEFHNGKTFTAKDAAWTINRVRDPEVGSPAKAVMDPIADVKVDGDHVLHIDLERPNADFPFLVYDYHLNVVPDGTAESAEKVVSTGPWKIKSFKPGVQTVLERNPNYWKEGLPYVDELVSFGIGDNTAQANALLSGEVEMIAALDERLIDKIDSDPDTQVLSQAGSSHATYPMRADTPPYDDNDVRLAIKHSIDRTKFLQLAFSGRGVEGRDHPVPRHDPFHCDEIPLPQQDPDKVAFHLKKAGHENTTFELVISDDTFGGVNGGLVLAEMANQAGCKVKVKRVPEDGYWDSTWMNAPWCGSAWFGRPTADMQLTTVYAAEAKWNESFWKHARFNEILVEARSVTDNAKRMEMYCELQWILHNEGAALIPVFRDWTDAHSTSVKNLQGHPDGPLGFYYWEEIWLES